MIKNWWDEIEPFC